MKQVYLQYEGGPRAVATLAEEDAPKTAASIWGALETPAVMDTLHAIYAGPEVMGAIPETHQTFKPLDIPDENQQVTFAPGDLIWYYQKPGQMGGLAFEMWEIGIFYGRGGRVFGPLGFLPVNIWATITSGLDEFAAESERIRWDGMKRLEIGRM